MHVSRRLRIFVLAVIASAGCLWAAAQDASPPSPPPQSPSPVSGGGRAPGVGPRRTLEGSNEMRWLSQTLSLTEEQKTKLRPIVDDEGAQLSAVRLDEHLPMDQKRTKTQEIREAFRPKIAEVLTPEQQEKWKKMQEAAQQKHEERMKSGDSGAVPPKPQ